MRKQKKNIVINVEPHNSRIQRLEGGFTWTFVSRMEDGRDKKINIKFERWWLSYLAKDLKKVLLEEDSELRRLWELSEIIREEG